MRAKMRCAGMQVDGVRCDMAVPGDAAALEDFSRDALGTVHLWCGPCQIKVLHNVRAGPLLLLLLPSQNIMCSFLARNASLLHRRRSCWWSCRVNSAGQVTRNTVLADVPAQEIVEAVGAGIVVWRLMQQLLCCNSAITVSPDSSTMGLSAYLAGKCYGSLEPPVKE